MRRSSHRKRTTGSWSNREDFSLLFEDEPNWLRPLAVKWRVSFGQFDSSVISLAMRNQLLSRLAIVGVTPRQQRPGVALYRRGPPMAGGRPAFILRGLGEKVTTCRIRITANGPPNFTDRSPHGRRPATT